MPLRRWFAHYGVAALATLALVLISIFLVWSQREDGYAQAEASVRNSARLLAGQAQHSMDQTDALLFSGSSRNCGTQG